MVSTSSSSRPDEATKSHPRSLAKSIESSTMSCWRDWASLACGPAMLIADRVLSGDVADYVRFRAACSAWRRCTADPHDDALDRRFHPRRWTMFDDIRRHSRARRYLWLLNFSTSESIRIAVRGLEPGGRTLLACTSQGLVVLINTQTGGVYVVNPITGAHADLPPVTTLLPGHPLDLVFPTRPDDTHFRAELTDDSVVVISFGRRHLLGVARPGDKHWAKVECEHWIRCFFSSAGRVYCISGATATFMVLETSPDQPPGLVKAFT